ncbi:hypothetical protein HUS23_06975 [Ectothiorhodospiraceae bacterium 2226]|nr:hypothetical protein HUS23_06975 [Ectothiorhodospiraceae bacterium 2226]
MAQWVKAAGAAVVSAGTGIGGHFVNQRWDRVILFFALGLLWLGFGPTIGMWLIEPFEAQRYVRLLAIGMLVIWGVSVAVTVWDGYRGTRATIARWTPTGIVGALLLSLIGMGVGLQYANYYLRANAGPTEFGEAGSPSASLPFFHASVRYGGNTVYGDEPPPPGDGALVGRVLYEGKPAAGVELQLFLDERYQSAAVTTDADGRYRLAVEPGAWRVNGIQATAWRAKPAGEFLMVSGREPALGADGVAPRPTFPDRGLAVEVTADQPGTVPDIEIRPRVRLLVPDDTTPSVSWSEDALGWEPYPGAATYVLSLWHVSHEGQTTTYRPVLSRPVAETSLPLMALPSVEAEAVETEYSVTVKAYDAQGRFLSETPRFRTTFTVDDRMLLADEGGWPQAGDAVDAETLALRRTNMDRIKLIALLIDERMWEPAETLLARLEGPVDPGEREALEGYLRAEQGRCAESQTLFEAAKAAGKRCIPERYEAACANRPPC